LIFKPFKLYKYPSYSKYGFEYAFTLKYKENNRHDGCWEYLRIEPYQSILLTKEEHCLLDLQENLKSMVEVDYPERDYMTLFFNSLFNKTRVV